MRFLIGKKLKMTQVYGDDGVVYPATVLTLPKQVVTQVKTKEKDGYTAIQIGYGEKKESRATKPSKGHTKDIGIFEGFKEVRVEGEETLKRGDVVELSVFKPGEIVAVSGISKGKGFQGGVKRHGFAGGSRTHGQKHSEREPGAIGGGARAGGRVAKGMRMAGRMGSDRVTVKNLKVLKLDAEAHELIVSGAIPGKPGTLIEVRPA